MSQWDAFPVANAPPAPSAGGAFDAFPIAGDTSAVARANPGYSFLGQTVRGATFGISDKMDALASTKPITRAYDALTGSDHSLGSFTDMYHAGLKEARDAGEQYAKDHPILSKLATGMGTLSAINPTSAVPNTLGGMMKQGATFGGISGFGNADESSLPAEAMTVGVGSGLGSLISGATGLVSRAIAPQVSPEVKTVLDAGSNPSLGQISGLKGAEEAAGKLPFMTSAVNAARSDDSTQFMRSTLNMALEPTGQKIAADTPMGHEAVKEALQKVGDIFDNAAKGTKVPINPAIDFAAARANVPPSLQSEFDLRIQQQVTDRLKGGALTGDAWKSAREGLGNVADRYIRKGTAQEEFLADALHDAQDKLHTALALANPQASADLANAGAAYRNLLPIKRAATYGEAMKAGGEFTPSDLLRAVAGGGGKSLASQGSAAMQPWAQAAYKVFGSGQPVQGMGSVEHPLATAIAAPVGALIRMGYSPAQAITQYLAQSSRPAAPMMAKYLNQISPALAATAGGRASGIVDQGMFQ